MRLPVYSGTFGPAEAERLLESPKEYDFWARGVWDDVQNRMLDAIGALGAAQPPGDAALSPAAAAATRRISSAAS